ncbi:Rdx family protein [Campylobacter sp. RM12327]|nr:Rdx family protein [Campylobacter sp. RM11302]MBF6668917.1 Rdx family protein [Campylobacter sp. RM12327]MBF6673831.1 Rdx family protein [Campylobacter sp. RM13538]MBF6677672.1 Rdx family protein [Campylobacter sp. RM11259]
MEEEIKNVYNDAKIELVAGSGGNFIIEVDGKIIFSKRDMDEPRFPNDGEILELIKMI